MAKRLMPCNNCRGEMALPSLALRWSYLCPYCSVKNHLYADNRPQKKYKSRWTGGSAAGVQILRIGSLGGIFSGLLTLPPWAQIFIVSFLVLFYFATLNLFIAYKFPEKPSDDE